ncbi:MAG: hypothetical protein JEZ01_20590 [Labilibaculum sp.]|nr:hypothetical protein [Labilibaculum sp.]MBI9060178.1 hypothetical protein [Labilibaculum sp.]
MNKLTITIKMVLALTLLSTFNLVSQDKKDISRLEKTNFSFFLNRTGIHTGNLVRTAYSNYGNLGSRTLIEARMEWPVGSGVLYGYEYVFFVASEVVTDEGDILHIISDRYGNGSSSGDIPSTVDHFWGWETKSGYFNDGVEIKGINEDLNNNGLLDMGEDLNNNGKLDTEYINKLEYPAMSHLLETWPFDWPEGSHTGTVGDRRNKWNGFYGAFVRADQESYYDMDDRSNDEFPYYPFPDNKEPFLSGGRRGVGLEVEVRNYQWNNPLAEDILISTYFVTNVSEKPLNKNILGMYVDSDVGQGDPDDDASSFDTFDDITYQWDIEGLDLQGRKTGYFGFAFLQSPGLIDGIDNDDDGMTDESQANGIDDDGDWVAFTDDNGDGVWDYEDLNFNGILDDGEDLNNDGVFDREQLNDDVGSDGLGPFDSGYTGADTDGTEGNGQPDNGEPNFERTDNDEIDQIGLTSFFGGGVSGQGIDDDESYWLTKIQPGFFNEATSGFDIAFSYGCGFFELMPHATESFAIANLFGNDFNDILRNKRTMQRIYDADFNFLKAPDNSNLTAIAGDKKINLFWDDLAEKSRDPIYGNDFAMYKLYRSTEPYFNSIKTISDAFGNPVLWESIAQFDMKDGLTGPHPIPLEGLGVSYDMGTDTGIHHSYVDSLVDNGRTYYYALVAVDQGYDLDFFDRGISEKEYLEAISPIESGKNIEVDVLGNVLSLGKNVVEVVPREAAAGNLPPVFENNIVHVSGSGTGSVLAVIVNPDLVKQRSYELFFTDDSTLEHNTAEVTIIDQSTGDTLLASTPTDFESDNFDLRIVDGLKFIIDNDDVTEVENVRWDNNTNLGIIIKDTEIKLPIDFEIRFFDELADTSYHMQSAFRIPVKFQVWNITETEEVQMEFLFTPTLNTDIDTSSSIQVGDEITIITDRRNRNFTKAWKLDFTITTGLEPIYPKAGDKLLVETLKPFSSEDIYEFSTSGWDDQSKQIENILDKIYVVPDPYVAVNSLETKRSAALSGRGERKIDFVNLPKECTISIFSVSGKLITILDHSALQDDGRESWDLTTRDGLEVAYGVYFFHVNAPGLGEKIGRFAIIK